MKINIIINFMFNHFLAQFFLTFVFSTSFSFSFNIHFLVLILIDLKYLINKFNSFFLSNNTVMLRATRLRKFVCSRSLRLRSDRFTNI